MPKIIDVEKKKREIAINSINVFLEHGFFQTKFADIAEVCGMGRTSIYKYFNNKEEIYFYILQLGFEYFEEQYQKICSNTTLTYMDKLKKLIDIYLINIGEQDITKRFVKFFLTVHFKQSMIEKKVQKLSDRIYQSIKELLAGAVREQEIIKIDVIAMSALIHAILEAISIQKSIKCYVDIQSQIKSLNILIDGLKY